MKIGEKIKKLRVLRGLTQKELGDMVGLTDSRIRQYELGKRNPKENMLKEIAQALGVPFTSLYNSPIETYDDAMHALFEMEENFGLELTTRSDGQMYLRFAPTSTMQSCFSSWAKKREQLEAGEITEEEYEIWKMRYPDSSAEDGRERLDRQKGIR